MYNGICESLLSIRVLVSGAKLADCIEQLIELNQQITLEINDSDGSEETSKKGIELEQKLIEISEELEEIEEKNGFVEEADIARVQKTVMGQLAQLVDQERERDRLVNVKQVKSKAKEVADTFDSIAELINMWSKVKGSMVILEEEVFDLSQQLIALKPGQANQFKGRLWAVWNLQ